MTPAEQALRVMHPLYQAGQGGANPTVPLSAKSLMIETIGFDVAKNLNRMWHSRLPKIGTGCIDNQPFLCFAACGAQSVAYAVAIWSNPVARELPQDTWLELRRLADAPDAPKNTASRMLRIMELMIRRSKPVVERLVSYHDTKAHTGGIYRAAGWTAVETNGSNTNWNMPGRPRPDSPSRAPKQRWEKIIHRRGLFAT